MNPIDLFKLRAAVGRYGEMDAAGWWNTEGVLGRRGAAVYSRGLPRTHPFARVRLVTAVARLRSKTVYPAPGAATLWELPPELERELVFAERTWSRAETETSAWDWEAFMEVLETPPGKSIAQWLVELGLISSEIASTVSQLPLEPGGRSVRIDPTLDDEAILKLAAAHARGATRSLVVPFVPDVLGAAA